MFEGAGLLVVVELVAVDGAPLVVVEPVVVEGAGLLVVVELVAVDGAPLVVVEPVVVSWLLLMEPH